LSRILTYCVNTDSDRKAVAWTSSFARVHSKKRVIRKRN
jgi:hypothetical protein